VAGIITAVTGLIVGLYQVGVLGDKDEKTPSTRPSEEAGGNRASAGGTGRSGSGATVVQLDETVNLPSAVYRITQAEIEPYAKGRDAVTLSVRMTNRANYPRNFWSDSFRLDVAGERLAPSELLNELVDADATKDGMVVFVVPEGTLRAELRITLEGVTEAADLDLAAPR
jgi:hypothetical protein